MMIPTDDILSEIDRIVFDKIRKNRPINYRRFLQDILDKYTVKQELRYFSGIVNGTHVITVIIYKFIARPRHKFGYVCDPSFEIKDVV